MEKVIKGESYPRTASVDVKTKIVTIKHVSRLVDGDHYLTTKVGLDGEDEADILKNGAYNYLIQDIRTRALKPYKSTDIDEDKVYRPCDYPATGGAGIDKRERSIRVLTEIGVERERAEYLIDHPDKIKSALDETVILRKKNDKK